MVEGRQREEKLVHGNHQSTMESLASTTYEKHPAHRRKRRPLRWTADQRKRREEIRKLKGRADSTDGRGGGW